MFFARNIQQQNLQEKINIGMRKVSAPALRADLLNTVSSFRETLKQYL